MVSFFYPPEISHIVTGGYFVCCGTDVTPLAYYGKCCDFIIAILHSPSLYYFMATSLLKKKKKNYYLFEISTYW